MCEQNAYLLEISEGSLLSGEESGLVSLRNRDETMLQVWWV